MTEETGFKSKILSSSGSHVDCYTPAGVNLIWPFFLMRMWLMFLVNTLSYYWHNLEETSSVTQRLRALGSGAQPQRVCFCVYIPPVTMQSAGPEIEDSFDFLFKIILVGDSDVGKTCVVQRFKSGIFIEKQQNTIGVDFTVRTLDIDGKKVKVGDSLQVLSHALCNAQSIFIMGVFYIWTETWIIGICLHTYICLKVNNPLLASVNHFFLF